MAIDPSNILLDGRVAIVTGGGSGIGRGIAAGLAAFGASVAIWEINPESCAAAAAEIGALGIVADVRDADAVDAALERTIAELGTVSILVNNAGGVFYSPLLDTAEKGWDTLYRANLRHVFLCTQRVARKMVAAKIGGSITNVTSIEGARAAPGAEERLAYSIPMARAGHVDEMAGAAVFLASALASYITGQTIHVDGGTQASGGWYHKPGTGDYIVGPP